MAWDDLPAYHQAYLIAYEQTKNHVEAERDADMMKAMVPKFTSGAKRGKKH